MKNYSKIKSSRRKTSDIIIEIIMIILAAIVMIPIYYLIVTTFKTPEESTISPLGLPKRLVFDNYVEAWKMMNYPRAFKNNFIITFFSVLLLIIFSSMASYTIARRYNKLNRIIYSVFLLGLMVPFQMAIIPLYKLASNLNMINNLWGVIIISTFCMNLPFSIFLFRGFINTVPIELEESAFIDGSGVFRTFWFIVFPSLKPIVATVAILNTLAIWNDFLTPLLFLQSREKSVIVQEIYRNIGQFSTDWTSFFPMMVLGVAPLLIFYISMQKYIIKGVISGSVKG
ncbi:MAG: L-arabinose transport system permease protein AraQ [Xylanivirga thermophila]|jgi:raffinose/stachyose/melibiose transport system permease protein|uniref:carbohydrate ABC transporter permease n=1 Tax=Xylanivirga thermophila TaxID=2496273 RepID=UPI0039F45DEE